MADDTLTLTLDTGNGNTGDVVIKLRPDLAPGHVARITELAGEGFYDGVVFHRVIDGFMAQTGDVQHGRQDGDTAMAGMGGSDLPDLAAEFNDVSFQPGTVGMARSQSPDSANSQFYIMFVPRISLDGKYTVFGRVISGMNFVDQIAPGEPPAEPTRIVRATLGG